jgi:hypothetical protein
LCTSASYRSKLACIHHSGSRQSHGGARKDVAQCLDRAVSEPAKVRVLRVHSYEDNDIEVTAGRPFSLWVQLVDQWGVDITHDSVTSMPTGGYRLALQINESNEQGAVLWGITANYSATLNPTKYGLQSSDAGGRVELNNLIVSQPGPLQFTFSIMLPRDAAVDETKRGSRVVLGVYNINIKEDPKQRESAFCLFAFRAGRSAADRSLLDVESDFPNTRTWFPIQYYLHFLVCADLLDAWFVGVQVHSTIAQGGNAGIWTEHRVGVAAVWTGGILGSVNDDMALPRAEQTAYERLGLVDPLKTPIGAQRGIKALSVSTVYVSCP